MKEYQVACQNGTVTTEQFDTIMHKASASAVEYSAKIKAGTGTAQSYASVQRTTNSALQEVSIGVGIASKAVKLFSATLNMIAFTAIINGISWLVGKVDEWIVTAKEAEESANAFKESLSTFFSETQSNLKTISSLSDRFDELSKNVDDNGKKIGGTEEEYAEFLDICQQVGQIMPELITGYTNEGEAIITLQGKVDSLTDSYKKSIKAKAALFISEGDEEGNKIDDFFKDYNNFVNGYDGVFGLKTAPASIQSKSEDFEEYYGYDKIHEWLSYVKDATFEELSNINTGGSVWGTYIARILKEEKFDINNITQENYNAVHDVLNNKLTVLEKELSDRVLNIRSAFQNMLYADSDYWNIDDENVISAINSLYSSIDAEFIKENQLFSQKALQTFESDFVSLFNNNATKQAMVDFYTPIADDEPVQDYVDRIKSSLKAIKTYCDENGIEIPITISDNDYVDSYERLQNSIRQITDDHGMADREEYSDLSEYTREFTQAQIELWLKATHGAQNATEAIQKYENELVAADETDLSISDIFSLKDAENNATALSDLSDQLSDVESAYNTCLAAKEEYDEQGYLSIDTLQKVLSLGDEYLQYLFDEEGNVRLDADAFQQLAQARINDMEAQALNNLAQNIQQITDEAAATEYLTKKQNELASSYVDVAANALMALRAVDGFADSKALKGAYNSFKTQYEQIKSLFANTRKGLSSTYTGKSTSKSSATKAVEDATKKTKDYIEAYMKFQKLSLESGRIDYNTYCNSVSNMLKSMYKDGKISAQDYHDYVGQMLETQLEVKVCLAS